MTERLSRQLHSVEDVRKRAERRLPRSIFDYIEGGSEDEVSLRRNRACFDDWAFVPKWGAIKNFSLDSTLLGAPVAMPLTLSPTGGTRLFHSGGEISVARAARDAGLPYGLAHLSTTTMEKVSAATPGLRRWFNLEPITDKRELQAVLERVKNAGYEAIMVNVDVRAIGHRERDYRNGFTAPPSIKPKTVLEGALHPRWALGFLTHEAIAFPNLDEHEPAGPLASSPDMWRTLLDGAYEATDWDDLAEIRARWQGRMIIKGCVNPADVVRAASLGIDAVQVSNHGGRQLDHMASPLDVLPEIVQAAAGRIEIIIDGGIRRGSDVVKALALGADACAIGRPYLYGLAAANQAGVAHILSLFAAEMKRTMMLLGVSSIDELRTEGKSLIRHRASHHTTTEKSNQR
ncbi:alpha-hydroxy-acid oxidizing enzyme [Subtercola lobariae]|uniref:Alpha-hydroxy-acid oxidizing enzyme n=1 Tax=Subtercola lobariae TaxID=1588641 RepID=A0A917EV64_9MICO|nr:alpha-hydroxy-acid oxidizing enzyme [Subtercola lobariae]